MFKIEAKYVRAEKEVSVIGSTSQQNLFFLAMSTFGDKKDANSGR